jgi:thiamine biosynthesis lipoprotein
MLSRRSFLALGAFVPFAPSRVAPKAFAHHFRYDHVIGTSLDLTIHARDEVTARLADRAVLNEMDRLTAILNTRNPDSEICKCEISGSHTGSRVLEDVLNLYDYWERATGGSLSIRPGGIGSSRNVDALGKAYIIEQVMRAAREASPKIQGIIVNIGGDIAVWGDAFEIGIADPSAAYDNAAPMTRVLLRDAAIATSGSYARGSHILNPRTGQPVSPALSATVIARDAVTANALSTMICVAGADEGLRLVESTPGAEALVIGASGREQRSTGFSRFEMRPVAQNTSPSGWPAGFQLTLSLVLTNGKSDDRGGRRTNHRPYVGVWAETTSNKLVRVMALWANEPRYYGELSILYNRAGRDPKSLLPIARATRPAGTYGLVWDGVDEQRMPVPMNSYKIVVEASQEGGSYTKQSGVIVCGESPAELKLSGTVNFDPVTIQYGPKSGQARQDA